MVAEGFQGVALAVTLPAEMEPAPEVREAYPRPQRGGDRSQNAQGHDRKMGLRPLPVTPESSSFPPEAFPLIPTPRRRIMGHGQYGFGN